MRIGKCDDSIGLLIGINGFLQEVIDLGIGISVFKPGNDFELCPYGFVYTNLRGDSSWNRSWQAEHLLVSITIIASCTSGGKDVI